MKRKRGYRYGTLDYFAKGCNDELLAIIVRELAIPQT